MTEPWRTDHRGLAIVPVVDGEAPHGYRAAYRINRALSAGGYETVLEGRCGDRYASEEAAREAAIDAAQARIDGFLGPG